MMNMRIDTNLDELTVRLRQEFNNGYRRGVAAGLKETLKQVNAIEKKEKKQPKHVYIVKDYTGDEPRDIGVYETEDKSLECVRNTAARRGVSASDIRLEDGTVQVNFAVLKYRVRPV